MRKPTLTLGAALIAAGATGIYLFLYSLTSAGIVNYLLYFLGPALLAVGIPFVGSTVLPKFFPGSMKNMAWKGVLFAAFPAAIGMSVFAANEEGSLLVGLAVLFFLVPGLLLILVACTSKQMEAPPKGP